MTRYQQLWDDYMDVLRMAAMGPCDGKGPVCTVMLPVHFTEDNVPMVDAKGESSILWPPGYPTELKLMILERAVKALRDGNIERTRHGEQPEDET